MLANTGIVFVTTQSTRPNQSCMFPYSSIPGNRNWPIETADWNLDVRLDILGVKKLYARLEILLRNWLAGSKTVLSISRDATVQVNRFQKSILVIVQYKYLKSCSGDFYCPESDPPHKIMRYWIYYSI